MQPDRLKWDGHTHGPYCSHGSSADLSQYIIRAIELEFGRISLTEHPPLPSGWLEDPSVQRTLSMPSEDLSRYLRDASAAKTRFSDQIDVRVGLELDFLDGSEAFTQRLVEQHQAVLDEVIISVHFLPGIGGVRCVDWSADDVKSGLIAYYGSMERLIEVYFEHQERAIHLARDFPIPARLGHATLVDKFKNQLPDYDAQIRRSHLDQTFQLLRKYNMALDANTSGLALASCGSTYPPAEDLMRAHQLGVQCVYGSDAHAPSAVGRYYEVYANSIGAGIA